MGPALAAALWAAGPADSPQVVRVVRTDSRTGKLVRKMIVTGQPAGSIKGTDHAVPAGIDAAVERIAATQALRPELVHSVIQVESHYNPLALSPKGAQGLMQLMPDTARRFGVANAFDPIDNIQGGARYLKYLLDLYHGDSRLALAAYNAGEGAVEKYGDVPPYPETLEYVDQVNREIRKRPAPARATESQAAASKAAEAPPSGPFPIQAVVAPDGSVRYISR